MNQKKVKPPKKTAEQVAKERSDKAIQETNGSSIVSKRSVERLYYPPEQHGHDTSHEHTHFFKFFVKKPQRRSPVINRGYWLRMEAIHFEVKKFLALNNYKKKVIVNLGCGYDPLPFQYLAKPSTNRDKVIFVDVDYPDLMKIKVDTIRACKELSIVLGDCVEVPKSCPHVLYATPSYFAVACDLSVVSSLESALNSCSLLSDDCDFLFIAEVSLTYMCTKDADNVIQWSATAGHNSTFVLLEQIMPAGPEHPFARTMMSHFNKLKTPIKSVSIYPSLNHQIARFQTRGFEFVECTDLYEFWRLKVTTDQKSHIASIEDFDEWEEFILYGQHYIILRASTDAIHSKPSADGPKPRLQTRNFSQVKTENIPHMRRRWGSTVAIDNGDLMYFGGLSSTTRMESNLLLSMSDIDSFEVAQGPRPSARMCHATVMIGGGLILLCGGRESPSKQLSDAWLFDTVQRTWSRIADMPTPRSRHNLIYDRNRVVLYGGNMNLPHDSQWMIYDATDDRWTVPSVHGAQLPVRLSPTVLPKHGFIEISGGFTEYGDIYADYNYTCNVADNEVHIEETSCDFEVVYARAGAQAISIPGRSVIVGGVKAGGLISMDESIVITECGAASRVQFPSYREFPLLIGFSLEYNYKYDTIYIAGGGGVCFSFGAYWNELVCMPIDENSTEPKAWRAIEESKLILLKPNGKHAGQEQAANKVLEIAVASPTSREDWNQIYKASTPVLVKNADIGTCTDKWSPEYLKAQLGDRKVTVHSSQAKSMNFQHKNFEYKIVKFGDFVDSVYHSDDKDAKMYLRSLSAENPKAKPANIHDDFPEIAHDFSLPHTLEQFIGDRAFSSVFRISSPDVGMWLHYDVTANVLVQVQGRKRVRMYPPSDVTHLSFPAGASSSTIPNIFEHTVAEPVHPYESVMEPGDMLFIPAMWLHATVPLEASISINTFFKDLASTEYSLSRDVYGNRDLKAYEDGRALLKRLTKSFDYLPPQIREFYLSRLAEELKKTA
ncbi:S-adenosyl-L-methionine-dependent methyltransferase [Lipomyces arxii]|uniref:S-adenosyl-L-methionine-dependent methyltransferase n=1 Tax=Lipomyces arxii TaxID=56418 RepID=UPI0034CFAB69